VIVASALAREILQAGLDDWVPLAAVHGLAQRVGDGSEQEIREASIEAIKQLVLEGLVEVGEVSDGGFFEWDETLDAALRRIRETWEATGPNVWGFAVWLSNTQAGDKEAARPSNGDADRGPSSRSK
jgi:hypothetical protein